MIRQYIIGDAKKVDVQDEQIFEALEGAKCFDEIEAYSFIGDDDKVLGVVGFRIVEDRGEGFAILGKKIGNKMVSLVRFIDRLIKEKMIKLGIEKVFITVKKSFYNGKRMGEMLDFCEVAEMENFFGDEDYLLMMRKGGECYGG